MLSTELRSKSIPLPVALEEDQEVESHFGERRHLFALASNRLMWRRSGPEGRGSGSMSGAAVHSVLEIDDLSHHTVFHERLNKFGAIEEGASVTVHSVGLQSPRAHPTP